MRRTAAGGLRSNRSTVNIRSALEKNCQERHPIDSRGILLPSESTRARVKSSLPSNGCRVGVKCVTHDDQDLCQPHTHDLRRQSFRNTAHMLLYWLTELTLPNSG